MSGSKILKEDLSFSGGVARVLLLAGVPVAFAAVLLLLPFFAAGCGDGGGGGASGSCAAGVIRCPEGFYCVDELEGPTCHCDGSVEGACGEGAVCDVQTGLCVCSTDDCCPEGYRFDHEAVACVCASDECCPEGYAFDESANMCVCVLDICCPPGFELGDDERCLCESDEACGEGFYCDSQTRDCRCENDEACGEEAFCNDFGFCQERAACTSSFDCPEGLVCNTDDGFCTSGYCAVDADCPFGRICQDGACRRGCQDNDDCWIAEACVNQECRGDTCDRLEQCGMGEICQGGQCVTEEGAYCDHCDPGSLTQQCPDGSVCLTFLIEGQEESFCAPECDRDAAVPCPSGYSCGGSIVPCDNGQCPLSNPLHPNYRPGLGCDVFHFHNEDPQEYCVESDGSLATGGTYCAPISRTCDNQPQRPGKGQRCTKLCADGLICADVGEGHRCYEPCSASMTCSGAYDCTPSATGVHNVCVPTG